ncbi:putative two-component system response regulator [Minicystis rosea]|nr:putative two-component system response regulator [Minicystis rosea]
MEADFTLRFETVDQLALAYGTEISTGGMFLATNDPLPMGRELLVRLVLPETLTEITMRARVMHSRAPAEADAAGLPAGMGVSFVSLDAATRTKIERFVAERIGAPEARTAQASPRERVSVLVVDDDLMYQQLIAAAFRREDQVRFATNGFEALALCGREVPDLIVSDVNMPKMDGWQLLRLLRTKPQFATVPLLFTTTLSSEADRLRGYRLGVDDYISKPFRVAELRARVDRLLARGTTASPPTPSGAPPAPPVTARSLRGDLSHVSLASVLGLLEMERRTGRLTAKEDTTGTLTLRDGLLVDAAVADGKVRGPNAVFVMLGWARGDFEFTLCDVPDHGENGTRVSALLIEHARLADERNR